MGDGTVTLPEKSPLEKVNTYTLKNEQNFIVARILIIFSSLLQTKNQSFMWITAGILRDKPLDDNLIYTPNNDKQYYTICRLKYLVGKFGSKQSKFNKNTQRFWTINFGYQCNLKSNVPSLPGIPELCLKCNNINAKLSNNFYNFHFLCTPLNASFLLVAFYCDQLKMDFLFEL